MYVLHGLCAGHLKKEQRGCSRPKGKLPPILTRLCLPNLKLRKTSTCVCDELKFMWSVFIRPTTSLLRDEAERNKDIAFLEAQVYKLVELFGEQRSATKDNVERRLARTAEELQEEEMEETVVSDDEDDEEKVLYNPKNIPLGWDGKVGACDTLTEVRQARDVGDNHANRVS